MKKTERCYIVVVVVVVVIADIMKVYCCLQVYQVSS